MRKNPNQRWVVNHCHGLVTWESASCRSTVIGWCNVVSIGQPSRSIPSMPPPRHWLSWTMSKLALRRPELLPGAQGEGARLREAGRAHDRQLERVVAIPDLPGMGDAEGIGVPVEVEPGERGEADPLVELRPRLSRQDLHGVTETAQLAGQVPRVHALAAAARVSPIGEERHPESAGLGRGRGDRGRGHDRRAPFPRLAGLSPALTRAPRHVVPRSGARPGQS